MQPTAVVFLSHGRWVARCPRPGCTNAEMAGRCDDGTHGGLDPSRGTFHCRTAYGGCGLTCAAAWPPNVTDIEALTMPRPVPATRNWAPGETIHDLLADNIQHGLVPADALNGGPTRTLLAIVGDEITVGAIDMAARPAIGG